MMISKKNCFKVKSLSNSKENLLSTSLKSIASKPGLKY